MFWDPFDPAQDPLAGLKEKTDGLWTNVYGNIDENVIERYVVKPLINWGNAKLEALKDWIVVNGVDFFELVALVVVVSVGLKMFLHYNSKKDFPIIYITIVCYTILRLFWRVVLHV